MLRPVACVAGGGGGGLATGSVGWGLATGLAVWTGFGMAEFKLFEKWSRAPLSQPKQWSSA